MLILLYTLLLLPYYCFTQYNSLLLQYYFLHNFTLASHNVTHALQIITPALQNLNPYLHNIALALHNINLTLLNITLIYTISTLFPTATGGGDEIHPPLLKTHFGVIDSDLFIHTCKPLSN